MSKTVVYVWRFPSSTSVLKSYETLAYSDGSLSCDCPGWTRRSQRSCKHTRSVQMGRADEMCSIHGPIGNHVAPSNIPATASAGAVTSPSFKRKFV